MPGQDKRFELGVFSLFLKASGLIALPTSILQLDPPNPDIVCEIKGTTRGFELSLITDPRIEKKVRRGMQSFAYLKLDPVGVLEKKLVKSYVPQLPIDLVLHEGATPMDHLPWGWKQAIYRSLSSAGHVPFERVWVMGLEPPSVLACFHRKGSEWVLPE